MSRRPLRASLALAISVFPLIGSAGDALSAERSLRPEYSQIYDVSVGGFKAGEIVVDARFAGDRYQVEAQAATAGIVAKFYKASLQAIAEGEIGDGALQPAHFRASTIDPKKSQHVEMTYRDGAPGKVRAEPAFHPKPWQIEPTEQTGTTDPITAALAVLLPDVAEETCNRRVDVFDGRRRYAIALAEPEIRNDAVVCQGAFIRIAGYKPKLMRKRPRWPFKITLRQEADGLYHLDRMIIEWPIGAAVIKKRDSLS